MPTKKKTPHQHGRELMEYFLGKYEDMYDEKPRGINRNNLTFGFKDLYQDYGDESKSLIDYYFDGYIVHDPNTFLKKYGDIAEEKLEEEKDAIWRKKVFAQTAKVLKEKNDK